MPERQLPFEMVLIDKIKIGPRARAQLNGAEVGESLTELREGIREHGLLHPIVVDNDLNLIAGFRRYTCCKELGWLELPTNRLGDLTETQRLEIELEENLLRKQFDCVETANLRRKIHEVKQQLYGVGGKANQYQSATQTAGAGQGWTLTQTATSLRTDKAALSKDITFSKVIEAMPQLAERDDDGKLLRDRAEIERQIRKMVEQLERELVLRQSLKAMQAVNEVVLGNVLEKILDVPDKTIDCIICDPPYGTDLQDIGLYQGRLYRIDAHFDDTKPYAQQLLARLLPQLKRVLKDNGHLYLFFGITEYQWVYDLLIANFQYVDAIPIIWSKAGNRWGTGDWRHHYTRSYEGIFFVSNPDRELTVVSPSVIDAGKGEDVKHSAEKPHALIQFLIEQSTREGEIVLDPTCGHGTTPIVCAQTKRRFWACEVVESAYREAKMGVAHELRRRAEKEVPEADTTGGPDTNAANPHDASF